MRKQDILQKQVRLFELQELLTDEDYRFSMKMRRCPPTEFFAPSTRQSEILAERERWLQEAPGRYVAAMADGDREVRAVQQAVNAWGGSSTVGRSTAPEPLRFARELGRMWEPDFLVIAPDDCGRFRLRLGCVCFPSGWALEEKLGEPLESIHGVVPGLNREIGNHINVFLQRMKPGIGWLRANWGISSSPERNQHPVRGLNLLTAQTDPASTWLRIEHQLLVKLEDAETILFGIRLENVPMELVRRDRALATGLGRALTSMPAAMLHYKNLDDVRDPLLSYLR